MASNLFILNDAPYGNERAYNALRLAAAVAGKDDQQVPVISRCFSSIPGAMPAKVDQSGS